MTPRLLRARERVSLPDMASRLGITVDDLRVLEGIDLRLWELDALMNYAGALGYRIRLVAARQADGAETELSI